MKRSIYMLILCCFAVMLSLSLFGKADGVVVRVGAVTYDVKQVQAALDELLAISEASGFTLSETERAEAAENTIENFVIRGLAENRIHELGLDILSKEIEYTLQEQAQQTYEQAWQQVRAQYDTEEVTDEQITELLDAAGVSGESYYQEYVLGYEMGLLLNHYGISIELNDAELDVFFRDYYVAPYEERYSENIPLYEQEVLFGDGESLFIPQGYRRIQQIVLPIPESIQQELDVLEARSIELNEMAQKAYHEVAELALAGKDIEASRQAYAEAKAELDQLEVEAGKLLSGILPEVQETVDEIYARLRSKESFEDISKFYGESAEDLPYHPESEMWPEEYAQALRTLNLPGDVSQPAVCADGVHIFYYAEDIPSGAVTLEGEQRDIVQAAAQQNLSAQALIELVSGWRTDYEIETDITQLKY